MGEQYLFQPLTTTDKVTVVLYRTGIVISTLVICCAAFLANTNDQTLASVRVPFVMVILLFKLYFGVGLSVFFIHLYIGKLYRFLKRIYYLAAVCLVVLVVLGGGNPLVPLFSKPAYPLLLLVPAAFCLGFVTAKEAFCFRLYEGYILFGLMPAYLVFCAMGVLTDKAASGGILLIAAMLLFFTLRKVFMPLHFDIGDKSAYTP